ncbi:MAG TPA: hypothetical protein VNW53_11745 [Phenylobacterium sp.]|uniref:hypothetical protein n=1 Tax=Phenylobacterium sp. TaxID=1871053 RepID=UPI002CE8E3A4|nr:hypothetical protein [Phenylobacterium sp.]HXA39666.1 hypothetical protein [Phenylobacterium sp.]
MAEADEARAAELDFIETLYGDPLRPATLKAGRNLLLFSLLQVAVVKFGAQVSSTSLFPLTFKHPDVLPTVLTALVVLSLANFTIRVLMEIGLLVEVEQRITAFTWRVQVEAARKAARDVDASMDDRGDEDPDPWWNDYYKVWQAAQSAVETVDQRLGRTNLVRAVRYLRAAAEALIPVAIALWAIALAAPQLRWPA